MFKLLHMRYFKRFAGNVRKFFKELRIHFEPQLYMTVLHHFCSNFIQSYNQQTGLNTLQTHKLLAQLCTSAYEEYKNLMNFITIHFLKEFNSSDEASSIIWLFCFRNQVQNCGYSSP
jgi:hypothetical protein